MSQPLYATSETHVTAGNAENPPKPAPLYETSEMHVTSSNS